MAKRLSTSSPNLRSSAITKRLRSSAGAKAKLPNSKSPSIARGKKGRKTRRAVFQEEKAIQTILSAKKEGNQWVYSVEEAVYRYHSGAKEILPPASMLESEIGDGGSDILDAFWFNIGPEQRKKAKDGTVLYPSMDFRGTWELNLDKAILQDLQDQASRAKEGQAEARKRAEDWEVHIEKNINQKQPSEIEGLNPDKKGVPKKGADYPNKGKVGRKDRKSGVAKAKVVDDNAKDEKPIQGGKPEKHALRNKKSDNNTGDEDSSKEVGGVEVGDLPTEEDEEESGEKQKKSASPAAIT